MKKNSVQSRIFEFLANTVNPVFTHISETFGNKNNALKAEKFEHAWREKIELAPTEQLQKMDISIIDWFLPIKNKTYLISCRAKIKGDNDIEILFSIGQNGCGEKVQDMLFDELSEVKERTLFENIKFNINELGNKCNISS